MPTIIELEKFVCHYSNYIVNYINSKRYPNEQLSYQSVKLCDTYHQSEGMNIWFNDKQFLKIDPNLNVYSNFIPYNTDTPQQLSKRLNRIYSTWSILN